jgi:hypothetical protein
MLRDPASQRVIGLRDTAPAQQMHRQSNYRTASKTGRTWPQRPIMVFYNPEMRKPVSSPSHMRAYVYT